MGEATRGGTAEPTSAKPKYKAGTGSFLKEKLISDRGLFSSYEGQQGAANGQDSWGFFRDAHGFGRLDADSRAGFTSPRSLPPWTSVLQFSYFYIMCSLEELRLVKQS